ncbi:MAG TPA: glycoside hydrolase family 64 protein [Holophaga sp.]|nr:glycoside hydrolase family 64 protein [Holophaga sp.]
MFKHLNTGQAFGLSLALLALMPTPLAAGERHPGPCFPRPRPRHQTRASKAPTRFVLSNRTAGPRGKEPVFVTLTAMDELGRFVRMDDRGRFLPCDPADNTVRIGDQDWAPYAIPLAKVRSFQVERGRLLRGARLYLSVGAPLWLRVDPVTGGLVQPDMNNPEDPNASTVFDWMEFALDGSGFHGNTTCVDQFGLPITLEVVEASGAKAGPVGIARRRSDILAAYRDAMPSAFAALADAGGLRILAPGHATQGPLTTYLDGYIRAMWERYRSEPLVLTPDEGTFTGRVDGQGRLVFTREGDACTYVIPRMPTTREAWRCDGPLTEGNATERVLGALLGALINRHTLEAPLSWRDEEADYDASPANSYAAFWHAEGIGGKAYGFAYDDVNDRSTLVNAADPLEVRVAFRID